jgi:ribosomal protein S27AE
MSSVTRTCPKCSKTMEQGLLADHSHYGLPVRQTWIAGEPRKGMLGGEKMPKGREIKITTWMCGSCGYLESYAERSKSS